MPFEQSFVTTSHDILLRIVPQLDVRSLQSLCLTNSHFVDACQAGLFHTIDTSGMSNKALEKLVSPANLGKIGRLTRRVRCIWSWRDPNVQNSRASRQTVEAWLVRRDELFTDLLGRVTHLCVASIVLGNGSPEHVPRDAARTSLDRPSLLACIRALVSKQSLVCLQLDFGLAPGYTSRLDEALAYEAFLRQLQDQNAMRSVTHLSIRNLAVPRLSQAGLRTPPRTLIRGWLQSFPSLRYLQLDSCLCDTDILTEMVLATLTGLEIIDGRQLHETSDLLRRIAGRELRLQQMRIAGQWSMGKTGVAQPICPGRLLKTLCVSMDYDKKPVRDLLQHIRAPALRILMLEGGVTKGADVAEVLESLDQTRFPVLKIIKVLQDWEEPSKPDERFSLPGMDHLKGQYGNRFEFEVVQDMERWTFEQSARLR